MTGHPRGQRRHRSHVDTTHPTAATPPPSPRAAVEQARAVPWFMDLHVAGERVADIIKLLVRDQMERVPDALATLVVQKQGIDWGRHHEIAAAIGAIGEHGKIPGDDESSAEVRAELERRTIAAEDLIGRLASEARMHRERGTS